MIVGMLKKRVLISEDTFWNIYRGNYMMFRIIFQNNLNEWRVEGI